MTVLFFRLLVLSPLPLTGTEQDPSAPLPLNLADWPALAAFFRVGIAESPTKGHSRYAWAPASEGSQKMDVLFFHSCCQRFLTIFQYVSLVRPHSGLIHPLITMT